MTGHAVAVRVLTRQCALACGQCQRQRQLTSIAPRTDPWFHPTCRPAPAPGRRLRENTDSDRPRAGNGPGRPGWSPTQVPHRSGRARQMHPVRHVVALSLTRSEVFAVTRLRGSMSSAWFQPLSTTRRPLRSPGSGRARSPASTLLWGAATPCRPSHRASFLRLAIPSVCPLFVPTSSGQESWGSTWSW